MEFQDSSAPQPCLTGLDLPLPVKSCLEWNEGLSRKFVVELSDSVRVETVLLQHAHRNTACLSTQAGCPLDCVFCATGQTGFTRNLSTAEIVAQAVIADEALRAKPDTFLRRTSSSALRGRGIRLRNVVLMGMGEPLLNYEAVLGALRILREPGGLSIGAARMTISTIGVIPGIVRLADEAQPYSLAVSLHAATQQERAAIVPAAHRWPLNELMDACQYYSRKLDRRIFFEWTMIDGANDSDDQARQLVEVLAGVHAHVNLIPLNPTQGYKGSASSNATLNRFQQTLIDSGIPCTVRQRRGLDVSAGCGQLAGMSSLGM